MLRSVMAQRILPPTRRPAPLWTARHHHMNIVLLALAPLGAMVLSGLSSLGRFGLFLGQVLGCMLTAPLKMRRVLRQVRFIGARSLVVIALTGLFTGPVLNRPMITGDTQPWRWCRISTTSSTPTRVNPPSIRCAGKVGPSSGPAVRVATSALGHLPRPAGPATLPLERKRLHAHLQ